MLVNKESIVVIRMYLIVVKDVISHRRREHRPLPKAVCSKVPTDQLLSVGVSQAAQVSLLTKTGMSLMYLV